MTASSQRCVQSRPAECAFEVAGRQAGTRAATSRASGYLFVVLCVLALLPAAHAVPTSEPSCPGQGPDPLGVIPTDKPNLVSTSWSCSQAVDTTFVTRRVDEYSTRITAQLQGEPFAYDVILDLPYGDPLVQESVQAAMLVLQGLASPLNFVGPDLVSSITSLVASDTQTLIDAQIQRLFLGGFAEFIAPTAYRTGLIGECTGFDITGPLAGTPTGCPTDTGTLVELSGAITALDTRVHTLTEIAQTTTTTEQYLTSAHYNLLGVPVTAVPEPGAFALLLLGLAGIAGFHRQRLPRARADRAADVSA